jgi:competence protein ComFC
MKILKILLDLIAPKKCYSCNKEWHFFCNNCQKLEYSFDRICYVCKSKTKNFEVHPECQKFVFYDKIIVLNHYRQKYTKKLIRDAKFNNKIHIYDDMWYFLYEKFILNEKIISKNNCIVTYIPSFWSKKIKRWFNWAEILSKKFSDISWIEYKNLTKKIKNTLSQSQLNKQKRLTNLENCFVINKKYKKTINNKNIIIIDDVISTWSTINEVSKILKKAWVNKITWVIIASD